MTKRFNRLVRCKHCGRATEDETPFGTWLRQHPSLDSTQNAITASDLDWVIHCYRHYADRKGTRNLQHIMIVEVKTQCADLSDSQRDTLVMLDQVIRDRQEKKQRKGNGQWISGSHFRSQVIKSSRNGNCVNVICYGVHALKMDGDCPKTSTRMTWDKHDVNEQQLVRLFRFELNPDSLRPLNLRRHKPAPPSKPLFP